MKRLYCDDNSVAELFASSVQKRIGVIELECVFQSRVLELK